MALFSKKIDKTKNSMKGLLSVLSIVLLLCVLFPVSVQGTTTPQTPITITYKISGTKFTKSYRTGTNVTNINLILKEAQEKAEAAGEDVTVTIRTFCLTDSYKPINFVNDYSQPAPLVINGSRLHVEICDMGGVNQALYVGNVGVTEEGQGMVIVKKGHLDVKNGMFRNYSTVAPCFYVTSTTPSLKSDAPATLTFSSGRVSVSSKYMDVLVVNGGLNINAGVTFLSSALRAIHIRTLGNLSFSTAGYSASIDGLDVDHGSIGDFMPSGVIPYAKSSEGAAITSKMVKGHYLRETFSLKYGELDPDEDPEEECTVHTYPAAWTVDSFYCATGNNVDSVRLCKLCKYCYWNRIDSLIKAPVFMTEKAGEIKFYNDYMDLATIASTLQDTDQVYVKLLNNVSNVETIKFNSTGTVFSLNGNGHTLTSESDTIFVVRKGKVLLNNINLKTEGEDTPAVSAMFSQGTDTLCIYGGTFTGEPALEVEDMGNTTVYGGTFVGGVHVNSNDPSNPFYLTHVLPPNTNFWYLDEGVYKPVASYEENYDSRTLYVLQHLKGDVNRDGRISMMDVAIMAALLKGVDVYTTYNVIVDKMAVNFNDNYNDDGDPLLDLEDLKTVVDIVLEDE